MKLPANIDEIIEQCYQRYLNITCSNLHPRFSRSDFNRCFKIFIETYVNSDWKDPEVSAVDRVRSHDGYQNSHEADFRAAILELNGLLEQIQKGA